MDPVDDEDMGGEQDESEAPTLAERFLRQHRPAVFGSARGDSGGEGVGVDNGTEEPQEADGELDVDTPEISGSHDVQGDGEGTVPAPVVCHQRMYSWLVDPERKGSVIHRYRREHKSTGMHLSNT